jgi:hypothetical protein
MAAFDYCVNGSPSHQVTEHNMLPACRSHRHFDSETILSIVPKLDVGLPILFAFCLPRSVVLTVVLPGKANQEPHAFYALVAALIIRDVEAGGSNPLTPTRQQKARPGISRSGFVHCGLLPYATSVTNCENGRRTFFRSTSQSPSSAR